MTACKIQLKILAVPRPCQGCNEDAVALYYLSGQDPYDDGLCAGCFCDKLINEGARFVLRARG